MTARRQPLVDHALETLRIATALPGGVGGDPAVLRSRCETALSEFAALATRAGHEAEGIEAARFALVALIDERAMAPGSPVRGEWLDRPLQLTLFECCSGGEEFYRRLERWRRPRRPQDADVLEVFQTCLALGFRGRMAGEAQAAARRQLAEQTAAEVRHADAFTVDLGPDNADRANLINLFVKKQAYSYLIDKSGFRDNLQIDNAIALFDYPTARANLLAALASQKPDGAPLHGFRPLNRHLYSDKPAWILMTVAWLVKESGDLGLLKEVVPYFESQESGTVWDHVQRAYRYLAKDLGKHGLCDQHHADWNDQLEPTKETGARESVMVSQQLCHGCIEIAELAEHLGDHAVAEECRAIQREMAAKINSVAWDGAWYQRTICEDGYRLGSSKNAEASIFINTQSWAVLGGVADEARSRQCLDSVDRLIEQPFGFMICAPPLTKYDPRIGRYCYVRPGWVENGGAYCHAAGFKLVADCMLGRAEEAWRTFVKVAPDNPGNPVSNSEIEPFSFTNFYGNVPQAMGKSGYPWRTGTAGWFTMGLIEWILGVRRDLKGLRIDPCLTRTIPHARVRRTFRGAVYDITIDNSAGRCRGVRSIEVDGKPISGQVIPPFAGGQHQVRVVI
ncbi:MAG TPA: hypothetical protein DCS97_06510 [Planctomycetes bacterium]|nr:hypothetical protein [Planctomycetota bacterium]